jgi:hypothetical protein
VEILAALSVGVLILSALTIAIKTFGLWRRSRQVPELLLSMMLFSVTVIGYPVAVACSLIPPAEVVSIHVVYPLAINGGFVCLLLFTQRVFRPKVPWAACLVGLTLLVLAASSVAYIAEVTGENPRELTKMVGLALFNSTGIAVAYFWTTLESLGSYRRLRLQLRLGLTEAIVANRVLLWGLMTLAAGVAVILNAVAILLGTPLSPPIVAISSGLGLLHAGFLFLAFNPPGWYRIWVERRHALENA